MSDKNKIVVLIAIIAGILLLISGISGVATWETIKDFVSTYVIDNYIIEIIFVILIFIASLGGIAVILGGLLIWKDKARTGKFMISLGAGVGLIGLIVSIIISIVKGSFVLVSYFSVGTLGLILSIIARLKVKKN